MISFFLLQINFNLENQVLREALEDLQRRKKEIQADNSSTQVNRAPVTMPNKSVAMDTEKARSIGSIFDLVLHQRMLEQCRQIFLLKRLLSL